MLVGDKISLEVGGETHLSDVSFEMAPGGLYTILGRTLAGKTTLLKSIAGLTEFDSGALSSSGEDFTNVPVWQRNVAMVYQQFINYPHFNVFNNIAFPLRKKGLSKDEIQKRVARSIEQVGLEGFELRKIQELSGGQQQRVALARSLAKASKILLLDEPLVNLDYKLREQLREELKDLIDSEFNKDGIVVYSTTDPLEAMQFGGTLLVMDEGRIIQQGPAVDVFEHPATCRVAEITNDPSMNLWPATFTGGQFHIAEGIDLPAPADTSGVNEGACIVGFRSNDIRIEAGGLEFVVELSEIAGSETIIHLRRGETGMIARVEGVVDLKMNEVVPVKINTDWLYIFGTDETLVKSPFGSKD
jgi:glycerol transport system ATP-binding protein